VFSVQVKGARESEPKVRPSTRKVTLETPLGEYALALMATCPLSLLPASGDVRTTPTVLEGDAGAAVVVVVVGAAVVVVVGAAVVVVGVSVVVVVVGVGVVVVVVVGAGVVVVVVGA
jgi:hypothetical protein